MLVGVPPFCHQSEGNPAENRIQLYNQIKNDCPNLNLDFLAEQPRDLCRQLLNKDPSARLGADGVASIMAHPWFAELDWVSLHNKTTPSPYRPQLDSDVDTKYFSEEFTQMGLSPENSCPQHTANIFNQNMPTNLLKADVIPIYTKYEPDDDDPRQHEDNL